VVWEGEMVGGLGKHCIVCPKDGSFWCWKEPSNGMGVFLSALVSASARVSVSGIYWFSAWSHSVHAGFVV
jgi:hypothetical protein